MKFLKINYSHHPLLSPYPKKSHHVSSAPVLNQAQRKIWQAIPILFLTTLFMFLTSIYSAADNATTENGKPIDLEGTRIMDTPVTQWCETAAQAKDETELKGVESQLAELQAKPIKDLKEAYESWEQDRRMVQKDRDKLLELETQVSAERAKLERESRTPSQKERELQTTVTGVKQEIAELRGLMQKVQELNTAVEEAKRAGSLGNYDDRPLAVLQAQLGRAQNIVTSYESEHGNLSTLQNQLTNFMGQLASEQQQAHVPNRSQLKDLERDLHYMTWDLQTSTNYERSGHWKVQRLIAINLGMEEMMKWIHVCVDDRRQQLASTAQPPQSQPPPQQANLIVPTVNPSQEGDLTAPTACFSRQGPFGCTGIIGGGSFKMTCNNLKYNSVSTREGDATFRFGRDGTVDIMFSNDGLSAGGMGAGNITPSGAVEVKDYASGNELQSWKMQFSLQPMAGGAVGPVGRGSLKIVTQVGGETCIVCEGELSLPAKKK